MAYIAPGREDALVDSEDGLVAGGFPAGAEVRLRSDVESAVAAWSCAATFVADADGTVDTRRDAPVSGDWSVVDPFGPYWSADLEERAAAISEAPLRVRATAVAGTASAEATFARGWSPSDAVEQEWEADGVVGRLVRPRDPAGCPGVVLLAGSAGGLGDLATARLLAGHGVASLAVGLWNLPGLPDAMLELPVELVGVAARRLREEPGVPDHPVTVVGASRGGELALLAGAHLPEQVGSSVSLVGSGAPWGAVGADVDVNLPAWTVGGVPVPKLWEDESDPDAVLADREALRAAAVPVERIRGQVLLVSGEDDAMWPATPLSEVAVDRAERYGAAERVRHLSYPDAGHLTGLPPGFAVPAGISHPVDGVHYSFGGTRAGNHAARRDSWRELVAFCRAAPKL